MKKITCLALLLILFSSCDYTKSNEINEPLGKENDSKTHLAFSSEECDKHKDDVAQYESGVDSLTPHPNKPDIKAEDVSIISPIIIDKNKGVSISINSKYSYPFIIAKVDITEIKFRNIQHKNMLLTPIIFNDLEFQINGNGIKTIQLELEEKLHDEFVNAQVYDRSCMLTIYFQTLQHKNVYSVKKENVSWTQYSR